MSSNTFILREHSGWEYVSGSLMRIERTNENTLSLNFHWNAKRTPHQPFAQPLEMARSLAQTMGVTLTAKSAGVCKIGEYVRVVYATPQHVHGETWFVTDGVHMMVATYSCDAPPTEDELAEVGSMVTSVWWPQKLFGIIVETPLSDDVRALVQALNEYTCQLTPAAYRHHMTVEQMAQADTTLFVARDASGATLGMGALRRHANGVGEVKRMFVKPEARGLGVGGAILARIEDLARQEGLSRVVLETGSNFDAAKRVYERSGFATCEPVLDYPPSAWTAFYAKSLSA